MSQKPRKDLLQERESQLGWRSMGTEGCLLDLATWRPFRLCQELLVGTMGMEDRRAEVRRGKEKGYGVPGR